MVEIPDSYRGVDDTIELQIARWVGEALLAEFHRFETIEQFIDWLSHLVETGGECESQAIGLT